VYEKSNDVRSLPDGFKRRKTNFLSGQPILMVERLGGVRRAARVKPNRRHGEFLLPPGSTLDEIFCFDFCPAFFVSDRLCSGLLVVAMMRYYHHMLGFLFLHPTFESAEKDRRKKARLQLRQRSSG
jgi:hypothetical protein